MSASIVCSHTPAPSVAVIASNTALSVLSTRQRSRRSTYSTAWIARPSMNLATWLRARWFT